MCSARQRTTVGVDVQRLVGSPFRDGDERSLRCGCIRRRTTPTAGRGGNCFGRARRARASLTPAPVSRRISDRRLSRPAGATAQHVNSRGDRGRRTTKFCHVPSIRPSAPCVITTATAGAVKRDRATRAMGLTRAAAPGAAAAADVVPPAAALRRRSLEGDEPGDAGPPGCARRRDDIPDIYQYVLPTWFGSHPRERAPRCGPTMTETRAASLDDAAAGVEASARRPPAAGPAPGGASVSPMIDVSIMRDVSTIWMVSTILRETRFACRTRLLASGR